jgi:hypothetical protein
MAEHYSMHDPRTQTNNDVVYSSEMDTYYNSSLGTNMDKLRNFTKFVPRQTISNFLAKNEIFKRILCTHGHIVECGVFLGGGLLTWGQLSAIYEPVNHTRRIIGFDTFSGFVSLNSKDIGDNHVCAKPGGLATDAYDDITEAIRLYNLNRAIGHIPRIELVVGNAMNTIPDFVKKNPHLVVAMLYLDFDLYEPTKAAIHSFLPRMPKGSIIAFDELNQAAWPGETQALLEEIGIDKLRIERFPFASAISYAVLE